MQFTRRAPSLARLRTGNRRAARIAIIAMTTSNSISVNPQANGVVLVWCGLTAFARTGRKQLPAVLALEKLAIKEQSSGKEAVAQDLRQTG